MYRKHNSHDELFSNMALSFILALLLAFLNVEKYLENSFLDIDSILFLTLLGIVTIMFLFHLGVFILNYRYERIDIEFDFEDDLIYLNNRKKSFPISDIQLFGYNKQKRDLRFLINKKLYGVLQEKLTDDKGNPISQTLIKRIEEETHVVKHSHLYNYPLTVLLVLLTAFFVFSFVYRDATGLDISFLCSIIFGGILVLYLIAIGINKYRLSRLTLKVKEEETPNDL